MMRLRRAVEACPASKYGVSPAVVLLALVQSGAETTLHTSCRSRMLPHIPGYCSSLAWSCVSSALLPTCCWWCPCFQSGQAWCFQLVMLLLCTSYPKSCHGLFFLKNQASSLALRGPYAISIYLLHLFVLFVRHELTSCCLLPLLSRRYIFGTLISMSASLSEQTSQMRHV